MSYHTAKVTYKRPDPYNKLKADVVKNSAADAAKAKQSTAMDIRSKLAQDSARHSAEEYAPVQKNWTKGVIDSEIYLNRDMVSDEALREKLGLPSTVNLDMLRTDPNLWSMFPTAQARLQQHEAELTSGTNAEAEDDKNWAMQGLGWMGGKMLDAGIKVGEAYELLWKPADMANEKLEKWFPEDATGVRRYLGNVLAATPLGVAGAQEGFQPRLPTPKQIQGLIQDSMADLNIGDDEQNERYRERILELKEEGMSDDEARLQAFEERTDIPGWVKFTLPIIADPLTYVGLGGTVKSLGRGATKAASGIRAGLGMEAGRDLLSKGGAGMRNTPVMPKAPIINDVVADASEGGGKFIPKRLLKLIDPSSELKHLVEGSVRKILVGAHIGGKHLQEFADQSGSFMRAQAEGHFGKLDDLWGKSVLDDDQGVLVREVIKGSGLVWPTTGKMVRVPLPDVIENFPKYVLNADQKAFVDYMGDMMKQFSDIGKVEGLNVGEWGTLGEAVFYMARNVKGFKDANGVQLIKEIERPAGATRKSAKGSFMKKRAFDEMQDGLDEGWLYDNIYDVVEIYTRSFYRAVANERMITHLKPLMRTKEVADNFPDFANMAKPIQSMMDSQSEWMKQLDSFINHGGTQISPKAVSSMKSAFKLLDDDTDALKALKEDILSEIDSVLAPRFDTWTKAIGKMDIEGFAIPGIDANKILGAIRAHRKGLKQAGIKGNIGATELRQAIKTLNVTRPQERKLMEEFMKKAGDEVRINRKGALASLRDKMGQVTPGSAQAWQKVQAEGRRLADKAANVDIRTEAQSSIFPRHIFTSQLGNDAKAAALMFDKAFTDDAGNFLKLAGDANSALRQMKTTWDLGAPLIQGLPILFKDAASWGKATGMMLRGLKDPAIRSRYVADNAEKISEYMQYGMHLGSSEMTEAGARGGWFAKIPRVLESGASRIGIGQETTHQTARRMATGAPRLIGQVSQRAQAGFDTYLDVARIEVIKALEATAMANPARAHKNMTELVQFANKLTGVASTKAMGVSATQRGIEASILMFSPRYTRATAALFMDMTRGGLRGDQARKAIASLFAGQLALHAAAAAALDQEVNLMPGHAQFMKVKVGDHWIGFGGKSNSLMNMAADVTQQGITDPKKFMDAKVWSQDTYNSNPLLKRLRYQMAPIGGEAISWLTGADPIGKTLPDTDDLLSDPEEFLKYVGPKFMPFSAEALMEGGAPSGMAEFFGGVSSPIQPSIHRDELREKYVKEKFGEQFSGITWDKFKTLPTYRSKYALLLEEYPDLQEAEDLVERTSKEFESSKERTAYQEKSTDIRRDQIHGTMDEEGKLVEQGYDQISQEFWSGANGRNAGKVFREKMTIINEAGSARKRDLRDQHPKLIHDRNEYFQGIAQENLTTAARNELFDFMSSPRARDAFGNINHQAIENFKSQIEVRYEQYGEGLGKIIVDEIRNNNGQQMLETPDGSSLPPLVVAYYDSWDVLRPFWDVYKEVLPEERWQDWELFSNSPDAQKNTLRLQGKFQSLERIVDNKRSQMRRSNYEIDKYLTMFFDYAPENPKRQSEIRLQMSRMRMGSS